MPSDYIIQNDNDFKLNYFRFLGIELFTRRLRYVQTNAHYECAIYRVETKHVANFHDL